ncbi:FkbM family methyltransferase [Pollutimonas sp. H1-120]|uniref:FkbM family methyltransferase n=1 Tax=Pollutimonas sp. H1-120 TaxID=3148824 RepID=UPI003B52A5EE
MAESISHPKTEKLQQALLRLGRNEALRHELLDWLKQAEKRLEGPSPFAVRDEITGPIVDALHTNEDKYEKTLEGGVRFQFLYRTKIAREFLLSAREHPTHVWEPQTTRLLQYLARNTKKDILIGGAYFGDHAILLGRQLEDSDRLIHCFEPDISQSGMLKINAEINNLDNMRIHPLGLWRESNQHLKLEGFDSLASSVVADNEPGAFATVSIDDYMATQGRACGLIMIDIEGGELNVLQGSATTLKQDKPVIVFEVHRDYVDWTNGLLATPICSLLTNAGYQIFAIRDFNSNQEMGQRPIELIPADKVYLEGPSHGFNMLAIQDKELISNALFSIVENVSPKLLRHKNPALHHPLDGLPD